MANAIPEQLRQKIVTQRLTEDQVMDFITDPETDPDAQWYALSHYEALVKMIELRERFRKRRIIRQNTLKPLTLHDKLQRERQRYEHAMEVEEDETKW